jgi:hypothetical protein
MSAAVVGVKNKGLKILNVFVVFAARPYVDIKYTQD